MKKILGLLILMLTLNGCDDGNVKIETINFDTAAIVSCGDFFYKLKSNEALFIKIPAAANAFENKITPLNAPRIITIGDDVSLTYRAYNGTVTSANICTLPQPISPVVIEEWVATAGRIEITATTLLSTPDAATGATRILKYNHNIVIKDLKFLKSNGETITYEEFPYGDYTTNATVLSLIFPKGDISKCSLTNTIYNINESRTAGIYIQNIDASLLSTTNLGVAKTGLINLTTNKLAYRLFNSAITGTNSNYFCSTPFPVDTIVNEEWIAQNGIANTSGIIEVITTTNGSGFLHSIRLKGVTFQRNGSTFFYGNDILIGELITPN
jgi:hypothetical protein